MVMVVILRGDVQFVRSTGFRVARQVQAKTRVKFEPLRLVY